MKNTSINVWSFATAKLQVISRRLITIAAIALAIIVSMTTLSLTGCSDGGGGGGGGGKTLDSIAVTAAEPTRTTHDINEDFDKTSIVVTATYSDGTTAVIAAKDYTISGYDKTTAGEQTITVTYKGKTATYTVTVVNVTPITVADITIVAPVMGAAPATAVSGEEQERFTAGRVTWSPTDNPFKGKIAYTATVTLTAKSGFTFKDLAPANAKINGNLATVSNKTSKTVTLSYTFAATSEKTVSSIAIKTQPNNLTSYTHGDELDLAGLVVTLTYDDHSTEDVAAATFSAKNITANPAHGIPLERTTYNNKPITITYGSLPSLSTGNLTVNAKSISDLTFEPASIPAQTYTGSAFTPAITVKHSVTSSTRTLRPDTDYTVAYSGNTNAGTATITITGKGDYMDTKSVNFTINKATPTLADYNENLFQVANNGANPIVDPVVKKSSGVRSNGAVTIYYEGVSGTTYAKSTTKPGVTGKYAVTFDVAAASDGNWNPVTGLSTTNQQPLMLNFFEDINSLRTALSLAAVNSTATAYPVKLNVSGLKDSSNDSGTAGKALKDNPTKYVSLDLSGSTFNMNEINLYAFVSCTNLTGVTIPASVTKIGSSAFSGCTSLASITIPNTVTSIESTAFNDCTSLASITLPTNASFTGIGSTSDHFGFFSGCTSLASITIPNNITIIGRYAFAYCTSLASITISDNITSIGEDAFFDCTSLASITVGSNNPNYASDGGILYNKAKTEFIQVPKRIAGSLTIPNGITTIARETFKDCTGLTSVIIGNGVTSIANMAFQGCSSLASVTLPTNASFVLISSSSFQDCTSLASITIPSNVATIGNMAFQGCTSLASITIPNTVTRIMAFAFNSCTNLASVKFEGTISEENFGSNYMGFTSPFLGDLRTKFYATDAAIGTAGTYTTSAPVSSSSTWAKQP